MRRRGEAAHASAGSCPKYDRRRSCTSSESDGAKRTGNAIFFGRRSTAADESHAATEHFLLPAIPDSKTYLAQRVEAKFASGEQNYKAGHLEAARKDFNDAVDWILESGYDPASSPRLNELFHRLVDTVYSYELQAFRAGDGFSEPPAVPAAIDEVAEMTFPVDPQLKARAEEAAKNISHDLPLTVNDEVLSFLNFFQTTRGRAIVETGLRRAGRYRRNDSAGAGRRKRAAGFDLSGAGGECVSAAGVITSGRAGDLAVCGVARK